MIRTRVCSSVLGRFGASNGSWTVNRMKAKFLQTSGRTVHSASVHHLCVRYYERGDPASVLKLEKDEEFASRASNLGSTEVSVKFLAAPINPADINMVEGNYALLSPLPAIGGNDGVAVVQDTGSGVANLSPGDWVIPANAGIGTWRTNAVVEADRLQRIRSDAPLEVAATLCVNPCTAYRMLKDFVDLKEGDSIIQNGANSSVGRSVIQLARAWGLRTINIVRSRPTLDDLKQELRDLGGDIVLAEEELRDKHGRQTLKQVPKPRLALNCIGGRSSMALVLNLSREGTMVTYGGMSKEKVQVPTGSLIFSDARLRGFWMSRWYEECKSEDRVKMVNEILDLAATGNFKMPSEDIPLENFYEALDRARSPYRNAKVLLRMST